MQSVSALIASMTPSVLLLLVKVTLILSVAQVIVQCMRRASAARRHFVWYVGLTCSLVIIALQCVVPSIAVRVASGSIWGPVSSVSVQPIVARGDGNANLVDEQNATNELREVSSTVQAAPARKEQLHTISAARSSSNSRSARANGNSTMSAPGACNSGSPLGTSHAANSCIASPQYAATQISWRVGLALLWFVGACVVLARFALAHVHLSQLTGSAHELDDEDWLHELQVARARIASSSVRLLTHADVTTPFTAGWLRPVIVLPEGARSYSAERRRAVLMHEMAHISRGDYLALCVATVSCALYWFHPLAWRAARSMRNESERAADDCVMSAGMNAVQYAGHLLALADFRAERRLNSVALGMARASQLEWRVRAMLDVTKSRVGISKRFARSGRAFSMLALVPIAGLRTHVSAAERDEGLGTTSPAATTIARGDAEFRTRKADGENTANLLPANAATNTSSAAIQIRRDERMPRDFAVMKTAHDSAPSRRGDVTTPPPAPTPGRSGADTVYEKTVSARDSVVIFLDMEAGGGVNFIRRKASTITVHASIPSPPLSITTDGNADSVRVHTFSSDSGERYKGTNKFALDLYMPFNARVIWRTYSPTGTRTVTKAGERINIRGMSSLDPKPFDGAAIPPAIDTTPKTVKPVQLRDTVFEQSLAVESGKTFNLNLPYGGDVIIHGWDEPRVRMNAMLTTRFGEGLRPTLMPVGPGVQLVTYRDARAVYEPLKWSLDSARYNGHVTYSGKYRGNHYEFWVPRHTNIVLSSTGGTVTISDVNGDLTGKTDYGFVDVRNAHGSMNLRTIVGSINVLNSTLTGVSSTQCGDVNAAGVSGALQLKTADGDRTADMNGVRPEVVTNIDNSFTVRMRACKPY